MGRGGMGHLQPDSAGSIGVLLQSSEGRRHVNPLRLLSSIAQQGVASSIFVHQPARREVRAQDIAGDAAQRGARGREVGASEQRAGERSR